MDKEDLMFAVAVMASVAIFVTVFIGLLFFDAGCGSFTVMQYETGRVPMRCVKEGL